jgi:hypothetical protein
VGTHHAEQEGTSPKLACKVKDGTLGCVPGSLMMVAGMPQFVCE